MRCIHRLLLAGTVASLLLGGSARADTIVKTDAGNFSTFTLVNLGNGDFELVLSPPARLTVVNGATVSIPATFDAALSFSATVSGNRLAITSGTFTKTFGSVDDIATLGYRLTAGMIGTGKNKNGLILSGLVLDVAPNALPGYDFSNMVGAVHTFALTGSRYTGGAESMADVFATAGASVTGSGGFSEVYAVPEPSSMALLGIGLSGLFTVRRLLKRIRFA